MNTAKLKKGTYIRGAITHEVVEQIEPNIHAHVIRNSTKGTKIRTR
jgi:hypothetical protein